MTHKLDDKLNKEVLINKEIDHTPKHMQRIPILDIVDLTSFSPLLNCSSFERLRHKKQLGTMRNIYSGAVHTRYEHSLGVFEITKRMAKNLKLDNDDANAVMAYALLHDVGHDPFSHNIEPLFTKNHDQRNSDYLSEFEPVLLQCRIAPEKVSAIAQEKNPLLALVKHCVVGADKLDYLARDAYHIGRKDCPEIDNIIKFLVFDGGELMVEEKNIDEVMKTQLLYYDMHTICYHIKQYVINNRMLQRAVQECLDAGELSENEIHGMVDSQLEARLENSKLDIVKNIYNMLIDRTQTYKSSVVFKLDGFCEEERIANKPVSVYPISEEMKNTFLAKFGHPRELTELEKELCGELKLRDGTILIATILDFDRIGIPKDTILYSRNGSQRSLLKSRPAYEKFLIEKAKANFYIRIVAKTDREGINFYFGEKINDFIKAKIKES